MFKKFYDLIMTNKYKKVLLVLLPVILSLVVLLILTSSGFMKAKVGNGAITDVNVSTCGTMTLSDSNPINLQNSYPMTDNRGLQTTPYTFTITNTCDVSSSFMVYLVVFSDSEIDASNVKYNLDTTGKTELIANLPERTMNTSVKNQLITKIGKSTISKVYALDTKSLAKGTSQTFNLRMWLDKDVGNEIINKNFIVTIAVADDNSSIAK